MQQYFKIHCWMFEGKVIESESWKMELVAIGWKSKDRFDDR